jgi:hypothetical protein
MMIITTIINHVGWEEVLRIMCQKKITKRSLRIDNSCITPATFQEFIKDDVTELNVSAGMNAV